MARTDAIVLGAGIVGTSIALQLAKRGLSVALVDRGGPGEETSYGNSGVIEGSTIMPPAFPSSLAAVMKVGLKQASDANFHWSYLPKVAPWLHGLPRQFAAGPDRGKRPRQSPAIRAGHRRARCADDGIRRDALSAQERLDQALSQRGSFRGAAPGPRPGARIRRALRGAGCRRRQETGAVAQSGVQARGVLAGGDQL